MKINPDSDEDSSEDSGEKRPFWWKVDLPTKRHTLTMTGEASNHRWLLLPVTTLWDMWRANQLQRNAWQAGRSRVGLEHGLCGLDWVWFN